MLSKGVLLSLLPPGSLWIAQEGEGLDNLLDGIAGCLEAVKDDLAGLAQVRSPQRTPMLGDLEREYGQLASLGVDEDTRRARLLAVKAAGNGDGSSDFLQDVLQTAGFNVQVHHNNPAVDPGFFVFYTPSAICGNESAVCGGSAAGALRGELLVNGDVYNAQALVQYPIPEDSGYWPLIFFIGGNATRDADGYLTDIETVDIPVERRRELADLVLKCKPLHAWAGLVLRYT